MTLIWTYQHSDYFPVPEHKFDTFFGSIVINSEGTVYLTTNSGDVFEGSETFSLLDSKGVYSDLYWNLRYGLVACDSFIYLMDYRKYTWHQVSNEISIQSYNIPNGAVYNKEQQCYSLFHLGLTHQVIFIKS